MCIHSNLTQAHRDSLAAGNERGRESIRRAIAVIRNVATAIRNDIGLADDVRASLGRAENALIDAMVAIPVIAPTSEFEFPQHLS